MRYWMIIFISSYGHLIPKYEILAFDPGIEPSTNKALMYLASCNKSDIEFVDIC